MWPTTGWPFRAVAEPCCSASAEMPLDAILPLVESPFPSSPKLVSLRVWGPRGATRPGKKNPPRAWALADRVGPSETLSVRGFPSSWAGTHHLLHGLGTAASGASMSAHAAATVDRAQAPARPPRLELTGTGLLSAAMAVAGRTRLRLPHPLRADTHHRRVRPDRGALGRLVHRGGRAVPTARADDLPGSCRSPRPWAGSDNRSAVRRDRLRVLAGLRWDRGPVRLGNAHEWAVRRNVVHDGDARRGHRRVRLPVRRPRHARRHAPLPRVERHPRRRRLGPATRGASPSRRRVEGDRGCGPRGRRPSRRGPAAVALPGRGRRPQARRDRGAFPAFEPRSASPSLPP